MPNISKNIDFKQLQKEITKYRTIKFSDNQNIKEIILVPYNEIIDYNNFYVNNFLVQADLIAKIKTQLGSKTILLPMININYNSKKIYNSSIGKQILYQKYRNFYKHCKFLGIQFGLSYKEFFDLNFHHKILDQLQYLQQKNILKNTYQVRQRSVESQSVLTKEEIYFKKEITETVYIKFFVEAKKHVILSHIDNILYFFGIVALLVHPKDKRYKKFIGRNVILPIVNKPIPIVPYDKINISNKSGTIALIPCHNAEHLELAKELKLPTNIYSITRQGEFSEYAKQFAGKNIYQFKGNLYQFLKDINNLERIEEIEKNVAYEKQTNQPVLNLASWQRVFQLPENFVLPELNYNIFPKSKTEYFEEKIYEPKNRCVSKQFENLYQYPFFEVKTGNEKKYYSLNLQKILENYKNLNKNIRSDIFLGIFIIIGYLNGYWADKFIIANIFEIINLKINKKLQHNIGQEIIIFMKNLFGDNKEIKNLEKFLFEEENFENIITTFENCPFIKIIKDDFCEINWNIIFEIQTQLKNIKVNKKGIYAIDHKLLSVLESFICTENYGNTNFNIVVDENTQDMITLFHQFLCSKQKNLTTNIYFNSTKNLINNPGIKIESIYHLKDFYGGDIIRLYTLFSKYENRENDINFYDFLVKKIWNGSRFLIGKFEEKNKIKFDLKNLNINELDEFDNWIIKKYKELIEKYKNYSNKQIDKDFWIEVIKTICFDFFDNYMTNSKNNLTDNKLILLNNILSISLQFLFVLTPFVAQKLRNLTNPNKNITDFNFELLNNINENIDYNFVITMEIFKIYNQRKYKYQGINILQFYIQGNSTITDLVKQYEPTLRNIIKKSELIFDTMSENNFIDQYSFIDVNLGIKIKEIQKNDKIDIHELEGIIYQTKQELQTIREILQIIQPNEIQIRQVYQAKFEELKNKLENLEIKLAKIKFNGN